MVEVLEDHDRLIDAKIVDVNDRLSDAIRPLLDELRGMARADPRYEPIVTPFNEQIAALFEEKRARPLPNSEIQTLVWRVRLEHGLRLRTITEHVPNTSALRSLLNRLIRPATHDRESHIVLATSNFHGGRR